MAAGLRALHHAGQLLPLQEVRSICERAPRFRHVLSYPCRLQEQSVLSQRPWNDLQGIPEVRLAPWQSSVLNVATLCQDPALFTSFRSVLSAETPRETSLLGWMTKTST